MGYVIFDTAWGAFGFVEQDRRLLATFLPRARREIVRTIRSLWSDAIETADALPHFRQAVIDYFDGKLVKFSVEIDLNRLPPFHRSVLEACRRIPFGHTASYADLARAAGKPNAARAVGGAMARNPLPLVVPCHRVLRADGSIGGFSSARGVDEKIRLLRLENAEFDWYETEAGVPTSLAMARFKGASRKRRPAMAV